MYQEGLEQYDSILEEYEAKSAQCAEIIKSFPDSESAKLFELLKKLEKNRDFKKLITEVYLQQEAIKLTHQLVQPGLKEDWIRDRLVGVSCLKDFFFNIEKAYHEGLERTEAAKADLAYYESELDQLRANEITE